ncbi:haloacid dehalogenase-like hydrolase [Vibrio sp. AK197]
MKIFVTSARAIFIAMLSLALCQTAMAKESDPLPSWNDGPTKSAIIEFMDKATDEYSEQYVPLDERVATFDNDGTLWSEKPLYFQLLFALDRVAQLAKDHPEWPKKTPFSYVLNGETDKLSTQDILTIVEATHSGMSSDEFDKIVKEWISTAKHPTTGKPYTSMVFKPMLELMNYFRSHGFKTFIVSGGGNAFMRAWVSSTYNIPPEQVIGSRMAAEYQIIDGKPQITRLPELVINNDKAMKPVEIYQAIGRRPVAAFGNSDGDLAMLQWTMAGKGPRLAMFVHHTDAKREWQYDRHSSVGKLDKGLDEAKAGGWLIADMKKDWKQIYPGDDK